jgi:hypothetical protein
MTPDALLNIMTVFVVVAAVALLVQTGLFFAMFMASRAIRKQIETLIAKVEPLAESGQKLVEEVRAYTKDISAKTNEIMDLSRKQLARVDDLMGEAAGRTRSQMDRIEMVLDDTVNRYQETIALLQSGILRPLRQFNAITAGIRAALAVMAGASRRTVEQATHDEEMFI